jgi:redox-sensitive bicupin YhaK (pirin superfamily)
MDLSRREWLAGTLGVVAATACRTPLVRARITRRLEHVLAGMPTMDGAGVKLMRIIGQPALRNLDPFILLDRFHSDEPEAYIRGFPDHPHRGFETVTVMLEGRMRHRDTKGGSGLIRGGGAQWMTAGRGIVHSEMQEQEQGLMSGFQLWVNLPSKEKMRPQEYQDLGPERLAEGRLGTAGSKARLIAGHLDGLVGPVRERVTAPLLFTLDLEDDVPFECDVEPGHSAFVFAGTGDVVVGPEQGGRTLGEGCIGLLGSGDRLRVRARERRAQLLVAAARPLNEPIVQRGPFVMNTDEEIRRAFDDYRSGVLDRG